MKKKGFTLVQMIIVIAILGVLGIIVISILTRPDITVYIGETNGKKTLVYIVIDRYDCKTLYFRDIGLDGTLDVVEDSHGLISTPNTITVRSELRVGWDTWVDRFEREIRPETVGN